MRLIDADDLKKNKVYSAERHEYVVPVYNIYNAPTVCGNNPKWCENCVSKGKCASIKPQGECENCDYRKFTETFVDGVVEVMNKNGITSVEQLSEILKGGVEE